MNCVLQILTLIHYTALALIFISAFDGMKYAITSGKTQAQLEAELSKEVGEPSELSYFTNRAYRTEKRCV